jgi:hypothetical protein
VWLDAASALMTSPNALNDLLIEAASRNRSPDAKSVRSLPARSTMQTFVGGRRLSSQCSVSVRMAWDRDESSFMSVAATVRVLLPSAKRYSMSCALVTTRFDTCSTYVPLSGCSRTLSDCYKEIHREKHEKD